MNNNKKILDDAILQAFANDRYFESRNGFYQSLKHHGINTHYSRVPVTLPPFLMNNTDYVELQFFCEQIIAAIEVILRVYCNDKQMQKRFPELERFRQLSLTQPAYKHWIHLARFDIAISPSKEFKLLETNCDCPGGFLLMPMIKRCFETTSLYNDHIAKFKSCPQPIYDLGYFINSMITNFQNTFATTKFPSIAFLTSKFRPILTDMNLIEYAAKKLKLNARNMFVQDLEIVDNVVSYNHLPIDIFYQKFDSYIDDEDQVKPCMYEHSKNEVSAYWRALQDKKVQVFNSFPAAMVAENKRILALLKDPDVQTLFSAQQKEVINKFCLDTYDMTIIEEVRLKEIIAKKDKYVLKKNIDTQGRSVTIGKFCSAQEWEILIKNAANRPYVIQEYIPQLINTVITSDNNEMQTYNNLGMFMVEGKASGLLCRSSTDVITNIAKNGSLRLVYIIS